MKYNYIFFNMGYDFFQALYIPLEREPNVLIHKNGFDGTALENKLFFMHWSHKINKRIKLPLKKVWFNRMYSNPFDDGKPLCFVFMGGKYIAESPELREYILKRDPRNKCIVYCADLISKKAWKMDEVKKRCDAVVTYNPMDAEKYGIYCYEKPLYSNIVPVTTPDEFDYDVFFLGFAKDRLQLIRDVYSTLTRAGLRCKFIVCGVDAKDRTDDGIDYGEPIPYIENIEYVKRSKCILELIQGGSNTGTLRRSESIVYKRKLLSNFVGLTETDSYNPGHMSVFSSPEEIDLDFIKSPIDYSVFSDGSEFSHVMLLEYFEQILEEKQ